MRRIVIGAAMLVLVAGQARGNLIINGGFEQPTTARFTPIVAGSTALVGWSVVAGSVEVIDDSVWPPFAGTQSLDLDGSARGTIEQSFATTIGFTYGLEFRYGNNPFAGATIPAQANVQVFGAGSLLSQSIVHGNSTPSNLNYTLFRGTFLADSTTTRLRFTSTNPPASVGGIVLDGVSVVVTIPEPSTMTSAGIAALMGLGAAWRRQRRAA